MNTTKIKVGNFVKRVKQMNHSAGLSLEDYFSVTNAKEVTRTKRPKAIASADPTKLQLVKQGQFAYRNVIHEGCGLNIGVMKEPIGITSSAYLVFEVVPNDLVLPEFLRILFCTKKFDEYVNKVAHGSARLAFNWQQFCQVEFDVPSLDVQHEVVHKFQVVEELIATKRSMYQNLMQVAEKLFIHSFMLVGDQGLEYPEHFETKTVSDVVKLFSGPTSPPTLSEQKTIQSPFPVYQNSGLIEVLHGYTTEANVNQPSVNITTKGAFAGTVYSRYAPHFVSNSSKSLIVNPGQCTVEYLGLFLKRSQLPMRGTTQPNLANQDLLRFPIQLPPLTEMESFSAKAAPILELVETLVDEIRDLEEVKQTWLSVFDPKLLGRSIR